MQKFNTTEEYFNSLSGRHLEMIATIRQIIRTTVPEATELISYNMPSFKLNGILVFYAAFSRHVSLFPADPTVFITFDEKLKKFRTSKGTIQFPLDQELPEALIKEIILYRVQKNLQKPKRK
jgi:uncharacterized protein YdhG (YjbR/CyaY superfamily)